MTAGREDPSTVASSVSRHVEAIVSAAERAATEVAQEVEASATERATEILAAAQAEAERISLETARRASEYLNQARGRIDAFATARIQRLTELTDAVIEVAESIEERYERADVVRRQLHELITTIGAVAEAVAHEVGVPDPELPAPPEPERARP